MEEEYDIDVLFNMEQQLTIRLFNPITQNDFIVTFIYAKCYAIERIELWDDVSISK